MKKIFSIIAMSLVLLSCGGKESGYEMALIGLDETEKALLGAECPINDEVCLGGAPAIDTYKLVPNSCVMAYKVDNDSAITSSDRIWGPMYWATIGNMGAQEEILDNFKNAELEECELLGMQVVGAVSTYNNVMSLYLWFKNDPDRRAYILIAEDKETVDDFIESKADFFEGLASENAKYLLYTFLKIASGGCNNYMTVFTKELSNGTNVRVACLALNKNL